MPTYEELSQDNAELLRRIAEQERQIAGLNRRIAELEKLLDELRRRAKRQAAPFSKGEPSADPKRPGAKPETCTASKQREPCPSGWTRRLWWIAPYAVSTARER